MIDLSVIIVSYNCREYLERCLRSVYASNARCSFGVVVVDNDSHDGSASVVREKFPTVSLIENTENAGFARANNQALRQANARYVMLLNPDTLVHGGTFDAIVSFLDENDDVWALGPAILNSDGTPQRTGVRFPSNWNLFVESLFLDRVLPNSRVFGAHREIYADHAKPREVDFVQGSCLVVRSAAIKEVGLLDEEYFMYFEETDWCIRMKHAGGRVVFFPGATVVHFGGGEVGHYDEQRLIHYHHSLIRFYRKHYGRWRIIGMKCIIAIRSTIRIITWLSVAVFKPSLRHYATSSVRGYAKSFKILASA